MTRSSTVRGWRGSVLTGLAGVTTALGLVIGTAATTHATPSTSPSPTPAQSPSAPSAQSPSSQSTRSTPAPTTPTATTAATAAAAAATATGGDVLDQLAEEYAVGSGGGQLSNLLKISLKLRAMGFKPSKPYLDELATAMDYRPNQLPMIDALKDTIAYQQKIRAQMQVLQQAQSQQNPNSAVMGAGQMPSAGNPAAVAPQPGPAAAAQPMPPMQPMPLTP